VRDEENGGEIAMSLQTVKKESEPERALLIKISFFPIFNLVACACAYLLLRIAKFSPNYFIFYFYFYFTERLSPRPNIYIYI